MSQQRGSRVAKVWRRTRGVTATPAVFPSRGSELVVVMLKNGGKGRTQAAPLAREVLVTYFGVAP